MASSQAGDASAALLDRAASLLSQGRPRAARPLLNAALCNALPSPRTLGLEARLLEGEGRRAEALEVLDRAVAAFPRSAQAWLARAGARAQANDPAGAASDAAEAIILDPTVPRAKALLGAALLEVGQIADARTCLAEAVAAEPDDPGYRQALARAEEAAGDPAAAARVLETGIAARPDHIGLRTSAILLHIRHGDCRGAEALAEAARRAGVVDACVFGLLGHARSSLGRHAEAVEAYEEARKLAAEDPYVRHLAAAAGLAPNARKAAPEYIEAVFNGYAPRFDAHLIELGYRIPGLVRRELLAAAPPGGIAGPMLDLGCGTGLLAVATGDLIAGPLIGVDLSERMLAMAGQRNLYAELHHADIERFLAAEQRQFPLILAGDVLPYFGDLAPVLRAVAARLRLGGRFTFSLEALAAGESPAEGWRLGRLGRYAHAAHHVAQAARDAGLGVAELRDEAIRLEAGVPVPGLFVTLTKEAA
jgi:predicted TPR repeat methyltransferase